MPKVTQLPILSTATATISFLIVEDKITKKIMYNTLVSQISVDAGVVPGPAGPAGEQGPPGGDGIGVPSGGITGQVLTKQSGADYDAIWANNTGTEGGTGVPSGGIIGQVLTKQSGANYDTIWANNTGTGGGTGLGSRTTSTVATGSILTGQSINVQLSGYKTYLLSKVVTTYPAWVVIYSDADSRNADSARNEGYDPLPGSGVIAEVITTSGALTQLITPGVIGFNNNAVPTETVYLRVTNNDVVSRNISVTLTLLQLES